MGLDWIGSFCLVVLTHVDLDWISGFLDLVFGIWYLVQLLFFDWLDCLGCLIGFVPCLVLSRLVQCCFNINALISVVVLVPFCVLFYPIY